jgi:hypothetical protein
MTPMIRVAWDYLQSRPARVRCPAKWLIFGCVAFFVLYPRPHLFLKNLHHWRSLDTLADPHAPELVPVSARFDAYLGERGFTPAESAAVLKAAERFVDREILYAWDWQVWGVADYVPTVSEVIRSGREDCDGRAVLAAALLRARGIAADLVGDPRHIWVRTQAGDAMNPLGEPVFVAGSGGLDVKWGRLLDPGPPAFGISVFPLERELILTLTLWALLLPARVTRVRAGSALLLLLLALWLLRWGGRDPVSPVLSLIAAGAGALMLAIAVCRFRLAGEVLQSGSAAVFSTPFPDRLHSIPNPVRVTVEERPRAGSL